MEARIMTPTDFNQSAQQLADHLRKMGNSTQFPDDVYEGMRITQVENTIKSCIKNKQKAELMLALLHTDDEDLLLLKIFLG